MSLCIVHHVSATPLVCFQPRSYYVLPGRERRGHSYFRFDGPLSEELRGPRFCFCFDGIGGGGTPGTAYSRVLRHDTIKT